MKSERAPAKKPHADNFTAADDSTTGRQRPPRRSGSLTVQHGDLCDLRRELERRGAGEWAALEALEAGDTSGACEILLALVADGGAEALPSLSCPDCGFDAVWPGVLEVHRLNAHHVELPEPEELRDAA